MLRLMNLSGFWCVLNFSSAYSVKRISYFVDFEDVLGVLDFFVYI